MDCSTQLLGCAGILSRCWLCPTTKLVCMRVCSSTQKLLLNKQLHSQQILNSWLWICLSNLALAEPRGIIPSTEGLPTCRCCLGKEHIHQPPLQGASNCLSKKVPHHCWGWKTWPRRRRRRRLVLSSPKPALWVSVLLRHLGFFSNCKHEWASYRKRLSWGFWKRKKWVFLERAWRLSKCLWPTWPPQAPRLISALLVHRLNSASHQRSEGWR